MGGSEIAGPFELGVVDVHRDDRGGTGETGTDNRRHPHASAADHGDRLTPRDLAGVDRRADTGHDPTAEQSGDCRVGGWVDFGALALVDEGLVDERADAQSRGELGAIGQCHFLRRVMGGEAVLLLPTLAGAALTAHRAPVEDHEVALGHVGDAISDRLHDACGS